MLSPNLVSTLHYGFTRAGTQTTGVLTSNYEWFRNISTPYGTSTGTARIIPVHLIGEDMSWNHGAHNIRFGGNFRYVTNQSQSYANSYSSASSNPSWLSGSGNDLLPATLGVSSSFKQNYEYAMAAVLGLEAQGNADYNYQVNGTLLPVGAPVSAILRTKKLRYTRRIPGRSRANHHYRWAFALAWSRRYTKSMGSRPRRIFRSRRGSARARTMPSKVCRSRTRV